MTSQAAGRTALVLAVAIVALGATMGAKGAPQSSLPRDDARFLQKAAAHNYAEIQLGQLAHQKAMREAKTRKPNEVTEFASRTVPILIEHLRMAQATYDIAAGPKRADERETGSTRR